MRGYMSRIAGLWATVVIVLGISGTAEAGIWRIEILRIESPAFGGASFGTVGQYEKLVGRAFGRVNPGDRRNAGITDIHLVPRNPFGSVEYSTDIYILRPINRSKGNHRLFFEINNGGSNFSFRQFNDVTTPVNDPTTAADAGNGFLMRQGYTMVWSGWDPTVTTGAAGFQPGFASASGGSRRVGQSQQASPAQPASSPDQRYARVLVATGCRRFSRDSWADL